MTDYVIMPKKDYEEACDAIRAKSGKTDVITSGEMANEIENLPTGGEDTSVLDALITRTITEIERDVEVVGTGAFAFSSLTSANFPYATKVEIRGFASSAKLITVNIPMLNTLGDYAFQACKKLETVDFPLLTSIGAGYTFDQSGLVKVCFPILKSIGVYCFSKCYSLTTADFPLVTNLAARSFENCSALTSLILRANTVAKLANVPTLGGTPIASGTGYIYVPSALVASYQAATNWSTYSAQFRALEDYTVDGTIAGELDESKI